MRTPGGIFDNRAYFGTRLSLVAQDRKTPQWVATEKIFEKVLFCRRR